MLQNARTPDEAVMMEQLRAISQNIPALYLLLTVAIAALGSTLLGSAPDWLTLWVPAAFFGFATIRLLAWRKMHQVLIDPDKARRQLTRIEIGTMLLFLGMALWIWALLPYANPQERLHFSFFAAFTGASSTICGISRPRLVGVCLAMTLAVFCFLFFSMSERFFYLATAQIGITYFVFFMASLSYKSRLAQSVALLNRLDVENRRSSELADTNRSMALTDMLTGLPNRRSFFQDVDTSYDPKKDKSLPVIGLIDLDGFKPINDVFGHTAGDAVLVETARRLKRVLGDGASVSRLGNERTLQPAEQGSQPRLGLDRVFLAILSGSVGTRPSGAGRLRAVPGQGAEGRPRDGILGLACADANARRRRASGSEEGRSRCRAATGVPADRQFHRWRNDPLRSAGPLGQSGTRLCVTDRIRGDCRKGGHDPAVDPGRGAQGAGTAARLAGPEIHVGEPFGTGHHLP